MGGGFGEGEALLDEADDGGGVFLEVEALEVDVVLDFVFGFSFTRFTSTASSPSPPRMEARTSRLVSSCMSRTHT